MYINVKLCKYILQRQTPRPPPIIQVYIQARIHNIIRSTYAYVHERHIFINTYVSRVYKTYEYIILYGTTPSAHTSSELHIISVIGIINVAAVSRIIACLLHRVTHAPVILL